LETIIVKTQAELDVLPKSFNEFTVIEIRSPANVMIGIPYHRESSRVVARESSRVEAWGSSSVEARGSSSVVARGSSSVVAWESSSVVAWDSSSVVAWGSSSVVAWDNSFTRIFSCSKLESYHHAIVTLQDFECDFVHKSDIPVIKTKTFQHDIKSFLEIYPAKRKIVVLYKSVCPETNCDFYTGKIKYEGIVICPDFDPNPERQCGGGLHLSPTPELARSYNSGKVLECHVHIDDIVIYGTDISKVRCRKVKVIRQLK